MDKHTQDIRYVRNNRPNATDEIIVRNMRSSFADPRSPVRNPREDDGYPLREKIELIKYDSIDNLYLDKKEETPLKRYASQTDISHRSSIVSGQACHTAR